VTTYPMHAVTLPAALNGQPNGKIDALMVPTPGLSDGPTVYLVAPAARAWRAMCAAALAAGHTLTTTSLYDSYRPYAVQESTFRARYQTTPIAGAARKTWNGQTWYQRPGTAVAAVPGTSNHGLGLAGDVANVDSALSWLLVNAGRFGWSWELTSEPWHLHYYPGDAIPAAVLANEEDDMQVNDLWAANTASKAHPVSYIDRINQTSRDAATAAAGVTALTAVVEQLAAVITAGGGTVDTAAILGGVDERLATLRAQVEADTRDAVADEAEGGAAAVRAGA
jgi:hypothetical protein